jgi:hypothetical protein
VAACALDATVVPAIAKAIMPAINFLLFIFYLLFFTQVFLNLFFNFGRVNLLTLAAKALKR